MAFAELVSQESYRMRSSAQYRGDYSQHRVRRINGRLFDFGRVFWGDGTVTVYATIDGRAERLHNWEGKPVPLVCGHVPSYGCDCNTIVAEADSV